MEKLKFVIFGIIIPILWFITYNIYCYKKKKVIYTIRKNDFKVIDDRFYAIQLSISIFNSICLTVIAYNLKLDYMVLLYLAVFWLINYAIKWISIGKKYAINESIQEKESS